MEKIWKELSCNLKENPKATLVQTQEAGRGLVATCDLQRQGQINYRTGTTYIHFFTHQDAYFRVPNNLGVQITV